ncbi:cytochrome P450 10-like [Porites lutea]|uniref:cytochrome P450 10-like n=1 Tax=Porites lutea TaxID=51062 RepID=UPI003CC630FE
MHDVMFAKYGPIYKEELLGRPTFPVFRIKIVELEPGVRTLTSQYNNLFKLPLNTARYHDDLKAGKIETECKQASRIETESEQPGRFQVLARFAHIYFRNGQEWYRLRHSISPKILRPKIVEENIENFKAVTKDAIARFVELKEKCGPNDHIPDLEGELGKWSMEGIGTFAFDTRLGLYEDPPNKQGVHFINTVRKRFELSQQLTFNPVGKVASQYFETPTLKKFLKASDDLFDIGQDLVKQKLRELKDETEKGLNSSDGPQVVSLLTYMITKGELSPEEINGMALDMIKDGVDTTSNSVLWMIYNLGKYPHIQDKIYQEVKSVVGKDGNVTTKHLAKVSYLKAFTRESMRLTPVTGVNLRILEQDVELSGYKVPAQTFIFFQEYCTARSEKYFKQPLEFKPERWLRENKDEIHSFSNQPFGFGTRMCVGRRVAELEIYVFLCQFLQRFRVESCHQEPVEPRQKLVTAPDKPVKIRLLDRL